MRAGRHNEASEPPIFDPTELRTAQLRSLARQTPINTLVTLVASSATTAILWPNAPRPWLAAWASAHIALALFLLLRWRRHRQRSAATRGTSRGLRRAKLWGLAAGLLWGSGAGFLPHISSVQQMVLILVIGAMACGASTTLAAVPQAAALFIVSSLAPVGVFFFFQGDAVHVGLASLAMMMTLAMIASTRAVYASLIDQLKAKQEAAHLLEELQVAQHQWLEISQTTDGFALFDEHDRLTLWNDNYGRVLSLPDGLLRRGIEHRELLRNASPPVDVEEGRLALDRWIDQQIRLHEHPDETSVHRLANGRWVRSRSRRTERGHVVSLHLDVTELKGAEEALRQRETELRQVQRLEAIGKLAGGVAHDFNNLLTIIAGYCDRLRNQLEAGHQAAESVEEISRATGSASRLTEQLLAFGRRQALKPKLVDINRLVEELGGLLRSVLPENIDIAIRLAPGIGSVRVDPGQIEQVVLNLVVNARDAMPEGGRLTLDTAEAVLEPGDPRLNPDTPPGRYVTVAIGDSGCGMDRDTLQHIFEPFFSLKPNGTGLGLATVHGIVKQSDGAISVASEPQRGTVFTLCLPHCDEPAERPEPAVERPIDVDGSEVILLVEDEDVLRALMRDVLEDRGYVVLDTGSPTEALRVGERHKGHIDLLITDVVMPEMNGPALASRITALHEELRVLFISGHAADALGQHGVLDPDVDFLQKPFSPVVLAGRVRQILAAPAKPHRSGSPSPASRTDE